MASKRIACRSSGEFREKIARKSVSLTSGGSPFHHVTLKHRRTTLERVEKFLSPIYFADVNLFGRIHHKLEALKSLQHYGPSEASYKEITEFKNSFKPFKVGNSFGPTFSRHWFKIEIIIPETWTGDKVQLIWNADCEGLVWRNDEPVFSLTGVEENGLRKRYTVFEKVQNYDEKVILYISVSCNRLLGEGKDGMINPPDMEKMFTLSNAGIVSVEENANEAFVDLNLLYNMAKSLPEDSQRGLEALYAANDIVNTLVNGDFSEHSYAEGKKIAKSFFETRSREGQHVVHAMGHCHIDSAWLWRYGETVHKCARSWLSAVALMDRHPEFTFVCSQAQQFQWVKDNYPQIYARVKHYVKEGRFIPVGGTWVEMDGNLPSGESMIRQFVLGQKFFGEEFGVRCREFWLPDTFGYSANLPQIMNEAGIENFLTQKISWNLVNTFPHNSFHWQGIDGSKVFCHFPPGDTYTMMATPEELLKTMNNNKDKGRMDTSVFLFGYGDGGGGPTEDMIHRLSRMSDCAGLPKVEMSTPDRFFSSARKNLGKCCTWAGELFLELHNGTYTTLAKIKNGNRKCEFLLRDVEFLYPLLGNGIDDAYPLEEIDRMWKLLLLNQFHDVLPGSSIELAHQDAIRYYGDIAESGERIIKEILGKSISPAKNKKSDVTVINSLSWERKEVIEQPDETLEYIQCPSMSIGPLQFLPPATVNIEQKDDGRISMSNDHLSCVFDSGGRLVSLQLCSAPKELVKTSTFGNQLILFDDVPLFWDAWDVMDYHLETRTPVLDVLEPLQVSTKSCGLRGILDYSIRVGKNSILRQSIELDAASPVVKFRTSIDWHENHKFLKVEFPWALNTTKATYEIQFGHLERPTHQNTTWDSARYEVWAHKWADLSEFNRGVALLNDCKYGYSAFGSTMRLSLLRSSKSPDGNADMGEHEFTYAIMPHEGSFQSAGVIRQAYQLNNPLRIVQGSVEKSRSFARLNTDSVIIDVCKNSDVHHGAVLIRMYEAFGGSTEAHVTFPGREIKKIKRCNALEDITDGAIVKVVGKDSFIAEFSPFKIKSFLVWLG